MWFLYGALIQFGISVAQKTMPTLGLILWPLGLLVFVLYVWTSIRLTQTILKLEAGEKIKDNEEHLLTRHAWSLFFPIIWLVILQVIIFIGGFFLLILPGLFLVVSLAYAPFFLVEENRHGLKALSASHELVKGRWWATAWRYFAGNLTFTALTQIISLALVVIISLIAGPAKFWPAMTHGSTDPLIQGILSLLQGVVSAAFLPLTVGFHVKLYRSLKDSR